MIISFIGHAHIFGEERIKGVVKEQIYRVVKREPITCYLRGWGEFDEICATSCREIKKEFGSTELVYITPYMDLWEQKKIKEFEELSLYDASIYPPIENVPRRFAILRRNEWMMENADLIIAYVAHSFGGAYKALRFLRTRKKKIINVCDLLENSTRPEVDPQ